MTTSMDAFTRSDEPETAPDGSPLEIVVIGAGTMGAGIAGVFAAAGWIARLHDVDLVAVERGIARVERDLERAVSRGTLVAGDREAAAARLYPAPELPAALGKASLVIEAIVEREDAKAALLATVGEHAPADALIASNTSSISISRLARRVAGPGRVLGLHFFNPVASLPLVEVVRGAETTDEATQRAHDIIRGIGKSPVVVNDAPGFVGNRLLLPMINEAIICLEQGVADREAIDAVMTLGMKHPIGPLALADLIGLDVCLAILDVLHRDLGDEKYRPARSLVDMVAAGTLGRKSGEGFFTYRDGRVQS